MKLPSKDERSIPSAPSSDEKADWGDIGTDRLEVGESPSGFSTAWFSIGE